MASIQELRKRPVFWIVLIIVLVVFVFFFVYFSESKHQKHPRSILRQDKSNENWRNSLKETIDPCFNFYDFACGNYLGGNASINDYDITETALIDKYNLYIKTCLNNSLSDNSPSESEAVQKMRKYRDVYRSVKFGDYAMSASDMLEEIKSIGSCPILDDEWSPTSFNLTNTYLQISKLLGRMFQIQLTTQVLPDGSTSLVLTTSNETKKQYDSVFYSNDAPRAYEADDMEYTAYDHLSSLIQQSNLPINRTDKELRMTAKNAIKIDAQVWKLMKKDGAYNTWEIEYDRIGNFIEAINMPLTKIQFNKLEEILPIFKLQYFTDNVQILPEVREQLMENPYIHVENIQVFRDLNTLYANLGPEKLANYLCIKYMETQRPYLDFDAFNGARDEYQSRTETVSLIQTSFPLIADHLFVDRCVGSNVVEAVKKIGAQVKIGAEKVLQENEWLDRESKNRALFKLQSMELVIGALNISLDAKQLDVYYANLDFLPSDNLRQMNRKLTLFEKQQQLLTFVQPELYITRVNNNRANQMNAFYQKSFNKVVMVAGFLFSPNFDIDYPASLNFGGVGGLIGHEIFHGFDFSGVFFDYDGSHKQWLTPKSLHEFQRRTSCLENQYKQAKHVEQYNFNVTNTLKEDMADNNGIIAAYYAFKNQNSEDRRLPGYENYNQDQMFFINYGTSFCTTRSELYKIWSMQKDIHSPNELRVNVPLKNMPEFSKAFNCPAGSPMNPVEGRCRVW